MERSRVGRMGFWLAIGLALFLAMGCDGPQPGLELFPEVEPGAEWAEVLVVIGPGPFVPGSLEGSRVVHGYPMQEYRVDGARVQVVYHVPDGAGEEEALEGRSGRTPFVMVDGRFEGWGWDHLDARWGEAAERGREASSRERAEGAGS